MGRKMDELMDMICRELDEIADKGELSAGDLDTIYKLIVAKEKLMRIEQIEGEQGYSRDGEWNASGVYARRGNSYDDNGNSMARRGMHYVRGHYSRDNRYSGADDVQSKLAELMDAPELNAQQKQTIKRMMDEM